MTWKIALFAVLMAFVTADAGCNEPTQGRRFFAMIFGIYATTGMMILLTVLEFKMGAVQ